MQDFVRQFAGDGAFDPDAIRSLGKAFDDAWQSLQASGATFGRDGYDASARELLARRIIELARQGERDPRKLCDGALIYFAETAQEQYRVAPKASWRRNARRS